MARFFRSDAEENAAEMMNDADSDDVDIYGEEEEEGDNFSDHPLPWFPHDFMSQRRDNARDEDPPVRPSRPCKFTVILSFISFFKLYFSFLYII